jgi:hypothetical protein
MARGNRGFSWESFAAPSHKTETVEMSRDLKRAINYKSPEEREDIKSKMWL